MMSQQGSPRASASSSLLLDSNIIVWLDNKSPRLPAHVLHRIQACPDVYVSAISALELSIKQTYGKLALQGSVSGMIQKKSLTELPVTVKHGEAVQALPLHQRDPFDRLLVAQAQVEGLILVTADQMLLRYGIPILLV